MSNIELEKPEAAVKAEIVDSAAQPQLQSQPDATPATQQAPEPISKNRVIAAFAVAIASDILAIPLGIFFPPGEIALDAVTAIALATIFRGVDLIFVLVFVLELPPVVSFLPWWTAIAFARWKGVQANDAFRFIANNIMRKGK